MMEALSEPAASRFPGEEIGMLLFITWLSGVTLYLYSGPWQPLYLGYAPIWPIDMYYGLSERRYSDD